MRQDEEKGYQRKNGYRQLEDKTDNGEAVYEKDGEIYIEKDYRYLVEATDEVI